MAHKVIANASGGEVVQLTQAEEYQLAIEAAAGEANRPNELFKELRRERNQKLAETDWVSARATDNGSAVPENWRLYRQALRDLPAQYTAESILGEITWPTKPD